MYVLGIDVGTTGTKTVVLDKDGKIHGLAYKDYPITSAPGGISEQSAEDWWDAVVYTVKESTKDIDKTKILALSLSTQGATTAFVDENFNSIRPAITWMDMRATEECKVLDDALGEDGIYNRCGWTTDPGSDAAKLLWIKKHEPEVFEKTYSFLSTIEFVNEKLTGQNVVDPTNASIREFFNINTGKWDKEILDIIGIDESRLPRVMPSGAYIGTLTKKASDTLGIPESVKVYNGAHDQYCASIGCGALTAGDMMLSTGTAWVLLGISDKLTYSKAHIVPGIHPKTGLYGNIASLSGVGNAMKWVKDTFESDYKTLDIEAEKRLESAKDIIFLPHFSGACFPRRDSAMSGGIYGLRLGNDKYDIARALMEGVAFNVRAGLEKYAEQGVDISALKIMGGASRSDLWCSIVGYVTGCKITRMENAEACAVGAAAIAAVGCGLTDGYVSLSKGEVMNLDDEKIYEHYNEKYKKYIAMYEAVEKAVHK